MEKTEAPKKSLSKVCLADSVEYNAAAGWRLVDIQEEERVVTLNEPVAHYQEAGPGSYPAGQWFRSDMCKGVLAKTKLFVMELDEESESARLREEVARLDEALSAARLNATAAQTKADAAEQALAQSVAKEQLTAFARDARQKERDDARVKIGELEKLTAMLDLENKKLSDAITEARVRRFQPRQQEPEAQAPTS